MFSETLETRPQPVEDEEADFAARPAIDGFLMVAKKRMLAPSLCFPSLETDSISQVISGKLSVLNYGNSPRRNAIMNPPSPGLLFSIRVYPIIIPKASYYGFYLCFLVLCTMLGLLCYYFCHCTVHPHQNKEKNKQVFPVVT